MTELRPKDLDLATRMLTISRVFVELVPKFHPEGKRFLVKHYPKDKEHRRVKLSNQMADKIEAYIEAQEIGEDDLLFPMLTSEQTRPRPLRLLVDPETLGKTGPNAKGR